MRRVEMKTTDRDVRRAAAVVVATIAFTWAVPHAAAQPLPRIEGPLTMEQAVDLAREKSL